LRESYTPTLKRWEQQLSITLILELNGDLSHGKRKPEDGLALSSIKTAFSR